MFGRSRLSRTHTQQLRHELAESYSHLKLAAAHAAGGAAERITPSYDRARGLASRRLYTTRSAFAPLYEQVREGAANARMAQRAGRRKKWPLLLGLLAAATVAGAAGAMVARRRRAAAQWDKYEPLPPIDDLGYGTTTPSTTGKKMAAGAAAVAEGVSSQAGKIAETLHEKSSRGGTDTGSPSDNPIP